MWLVTQARVVLVTQFFQLIEVNPKLSVYILRQYVR
jgi:hypothetical protein